MRKDLSGNEDNTTGRHEARGSKDTSRIYEQGPRDPRGELVCQEPRKRRETTPEKGQSRWEQSPVKSATGRGVQRNHWEQEMRSTETRSEGANVAQDPKEGDLPPAERGPRRLHGGPVPTTPQVTPTVGRLSQKTENEPRDPAATPEHGEGPTAWPRWKTAWHFLKMSRVTPEFQQPTRRCSPRTRGPVWPRTDLRT